jgi:hypothetical protein
MLLNIPKTNNYYIDILLFPLFVGFLGNIIKFLKHKLPVIFNYFKTFIFFKDDNVAKLEFEGHISYTSNNIKVNFDRGMSAFFYYIYKNQDEIKGLKYLKRIPDIKHYLEDTEVQREIFEEFFIAQKTPIYLNNEVSIHPSISNKDVDEEYTKKNIKITQYGIQVRYKKFASSDENMKYLLKLYNKLRSDYLEAKETNNNTDNQYVYMFDTKKGQKVIFNRYTIKDEAKKIEHMYFPEKEQLVKDLDTFFKSKDLYKKKGKSYRKIILAYGIPGCGKTSLLSSLANMSYCSNGKYPRQLIHLKLDKLTRKDLMDILFKETIYLNDDGCVKIPFDRRIYYIEEMDGYKITHKRTFSDKSQKNDSVQKSKLLTSINQICNSKDSDNDSNYDTDDSDTSCSKNDKIGKQITKLLGDNEDKSVLGIQDLLEALDGIPSMKNGEIIYMTTNHIDKIDDALKRPGRVNFLIHFKKLTKVLLIKQVETYFNDTIDSKSKIQLKDDAYTPAEIELICDSSLNICDALSKIIK